MYAVAVKTFMVVPIYIRKTAETFSSKYHAV